MYYVYCNIRGSWNVYSFQLFISIKQTAAFALSDMNKTTQWKSLVLKTKALRSFERSASTPSDKSHPGRTPSWVTTLWTPQISRSFEFHSRHGNFSDCTAVRPSASEGHFTRDLWSWSAAFSKMTDKAVGPNTSYTAHLEQTLHYRGLSWFSVCTERITFEPEQKKASKIPLINSVNFDNSLCVHIPIVCS